jgi:ribose transport system ATP-binding protein
MALLELHGIRKSFGATRALTGVDLQVDRGEVLALIGENGAGKSTLMNILAGAFPSDEGSMLLGGAPYEPKDPREGRRSGIGYIHQELSLCPHLSVAENILLGLEPASMGWIDRSAVVKRARQLLVQFGCEYIHPDTRAGNLSVADQQVVEICRALASNARILLMDEPTSSLSQRNIERLFAAVRKLRQEGMAIIYISHFLEEVRQIGDHFTVLRDGKSILSGPLDSATDAQIITAMVGRDVDQLFPEIQTSSRTAEPILKVERLSSPPRLRSASFALYPGEVLGISGLIGSGRTEMVRALFGLAPAEGAVFLNGRSVPLRKIDSAAQIRSGFGYLSEDRKGEGLCLQLSVADNLTLTRMDSVATAGWIKARRQTDMSAKIMQRLNVRAAGPEAKVITLSGGNQQKVAMGRLLHQDPQVLLLDEPTRGIDIGSKSDIYLEIRRLAASGKAILMVSSYIPELLGVCDRIAVMSRGELSPARPTTEWTAESIMEVAIGGADSQCDIPPGGLN